MITIVVADTAELPAVADGIFAALPDRPGEFELTGGRCDSCDKFFFPVPEHCCHCLGNITLTGLGSNGRIYSCTVVRTKPPLGLPRPYAVAYVDLDAVPLRVFALLDPEQVDSLGIGTRVHLAVGQLGIDQAGQPCLRPFFKLVPGTD